jgi:hypothetical protein
MVVWVTVSAPAPRPDGPLEGSPEPRERQVMEKALLLTESECGRLLREQMNMPFWRFRRRRELNMELVTKKRQARSYREFLDE